MLALVLWMVIRLLWILSATEHVLSELKDCTRIELQRTGMMWAHAIGVCRQTDKHKGQMCTPLTQ